MANRYQQELDGIKQTASEEAQQRADVLFTNYLEEDEESAHNRVVPMSPGTS